MIDQSHPDSKLKSSNKLTSSKSLAGRRPLGKKSRTKILEEEMTGEAAQKEEMAKAVSEEIDIVSQGISDKVKVCVRVRPKLRKEFVAEEVVMVEDCEGVTSKIQVVRDMERIESYYDQVFAKETSQEEIFEFTRPAISGVIDGFNATVFAYGQTGSGKTFTMFGPHWETSVRNSALSLNQYLKHNGSIKQRYDLFDNEEKYGIIPRAIQLIFDRISHEQDRSGDMDKYTVYCSFLQIYNENLYDLLQDGKLK